VRLEFPEVEMLGCDPTNRLWKNKHGSMSEANSTKENSSNNKT
jgi:hypothetical protein